ncbi:hypothetical protein G6F37_007261 [Rhizopus arrhizus]|nr:hypothetical protein G6F38_007471 [Rhizopus arrhizus]KAG1156823.1 hypothetical protein G6F37_007261 [Rhizopus arrhizus]
MHKSKNKIFKKPRKAPSAPQGRVGQDEAQQGLSSTNAMSVTSSKVSNVMKRKRYLQSEPTNELKIHPATLVTIEADSELMSTLEVPAGLFSSFLL